MNDEEKPHGTGREVIETSIKQFLYKDNCFIEQLSVWSSGMILP